MEELVLQYQKNKDELILAEIYDEFKPFTLKYLSKEFTKNGFCYHETDLEEIFHDTLMKTINKFQTGEFKRYYTRSLQNTLRDHIRKVKRRKEDYTPETLEELEANTYCLKDYPSETIDTYLYMLNDLEKEFFLDLKMNGLTLEHMSAKYRLSIQQVRTKGKHMLELVQTRLKKDVDKFN